MVHPAVAVQSAYSVMGEPLARLTHCAAKLAWLCRFHAKAAACTRCWELVGPCDNQSLWAPLSSWDRLLGVAGEASMLYSDHLQHTFFLSGFCLFLCFTFETVALSELLLASIMLSGPKDAAWLAHYTRLTCWPDQDPLCALLLPEEVHSLLEDNKEYWHWFESIERHYWIERRIVLMNLVKPIKLVSGAEWGVMEGHNDFCRTGCVNSESMWTMLVARNKVALATTFEPCSCANNRTKCKKAWFVCLIARSYSHSSLLLDIDIPPSSFLLYFHVLGLTVVVVVMCWFF